MARAWAKPAAFFLGLCLFAQAAAVADEADDAKKAVEALGLRVLSTGLAMPDETQLSKALRDSTKIKRSLFDAAKDQDTLQGKVELNKKRITQLTQLNVKLNAQLANINPNNVALNNRLVGAINANVGQVDLFRKGNQQLESQLKAARQAANQAREAYVQHVLDMRSLADGIALEYEKKGADAEVKQAVARLSQATGKSYELGQSRSFQGSVKRLKALEDTVLSESIPLRKDGGDSYYVSVVVDGKHTQEMAVDSGASLISLPHKLALAWGIQPSDSDPTIILELADGSQISAKLVTLPSVRVGKFSVDNVEAAVLGADAVNAEPLLGMSFLGAFKFELDPSAGKLTMVKVETPQSGRTRRR